MAVAVDLVTARQVLETVVVAVHRQSSLGQCRPLDAGVQSHVSYPGWTV